MKKFLKINFMLLIMGFMSISIMHLNAASLANTGHKEFTSLTFLYNPEAKLLINTDKKTLEELMNGIKRKAFGWSINYNIVNYRVVYEAESIFSRSNNTSQTINFTYNTTSTTHKQLTLGGSSTIGMKLSGKIDTISATLDTTIKNELGFKSEKTFKEDIDFSIKILPHKRVSLVVKGFGNLSNGAAKNYFLGICLKKKYWESVEILNEYYELYEEEIPY